MVAVQKFQHVPWLKQAAVTGIDISDEMRK